MIPAHSPESAPHSAAPDLPTHPLTSAYYARLHPWLIIRYLPQIQRLAVARFRHRPEAEAHLQALRQLAPEANYRILFDPGEADTEY
jgi:hypothetical protein